MHSEQCNREQCVNSTLLLSYGIVTPPIQEVLWLQVRAFHQGAINRLDTERPAHTGRTRSNNYKPLPI